jgi:hypothetical protein
MMTNTDLPKPDVRRRARSLCRITGLSYSLDEPHYFPHKSDFPQFDRRSSCHITVGHDVLGDKYHYPVVGPIINNDQSDDEILYRETIKGQQFAYSVHPKCQNEKSNGNYSRKLDFFDDPSQILRERFMQKPRVSNESEANLMSKPPNGLHNGHSEINFPPKRRSRSLKCMRSNQKQQTQPERCRQISQTTQSKQQISDISDDSKNGKFKDKRSSMAQKNGSANTGKGIKKDSLNKSVRKESQESLLETEKNLTKVIQTKNQKPNQSKEKTNEIEDPKMNKNKMNANESTKCETQTNIIKNIHCDQKNESSKNKPKKLVNKKANITQSNIANKVSESDQNIIINENKTENSILKYSQTNQTHHLQVIFIELFYSTN